MAEKHGPAPVMNDMVKKLIVGDPRNRDDRESKKNVKSSTKTKKK